MAQLIFNENVVGPSNPSAGQLTLYAKTNDFLYIKNSAGVETLLSVSTGTVSSVALLDGSTTPIFTISGSPVTSSGTLTFTLKTETANTVFAGPTTGAAAQPTFRSLVSADIPVLAYVNTVGAFNNTSTANGLDISTNTITLHAADGTNPGAVSTTTQTFSGNKTFSGTVAVSPSSTTALTINTTAFIFDSTNNALGIGLQPSTAVAIDILNTSGASKAVQSTGYGLTSTPVFRGRFARGTVGTPAAVQAGDILGVMSGRGYGTSQFAAASTGVLNIVAGETFTNTSNLTYLQFMTTPTGSVTSSESMRIATTGVTLGPQSASTAIHQINGGLNNTTRTVTASTFTVDTTTTDYVVYTDSTSNTITITLPAPTNGRTLIFQDKTGKAATNNVTIKQHAAETINGLTQLVLASNYAGFTLTSDGTNWNALVISTSGNLFITSGTTYTTPVNITPQTRFKFTLVGGGGGGGGAPTGATTQHSTGGGGGGGGIVWLTGLSANTAYTIAIGAAGAQGTNTPTAGGNGGNTTLTVGATTYTASGGGGGPATISTTAGGAGGGTTNLTLSVIGQYGQGSGSASTAGVPGPGGNSMLGLGGVGTVVFIGNDGNNGTGYGGGGGGTTGTNGFGGAGSQGCILVEWNN